MKTRKRNTKTITIHYTKELTPATALKATLDYIERDIMNLWKYTIEHRPYKHLDWDIFIIRKEGK